MKYQFEWQYSDDPSDLDESEPYIHFVFMLRFPDMPLGRGHVAHFCFNVLQNPENTELGISVVRRGFLKCVPYSKPIVERFVEDAVASAFSENAGAEALSILNEQFINSDVDFSNEFAGELLEADELLDLIENTFDGVARGEAITLHQANVVDDYGSQDEFLAAAKNDTESRWQDVPDSAIAEIPGPFHFLDYAGFRYYIPAYMCWAARNYTEDSSDSAAFFTYLAVLPTVAPREIGRGLGEAFDLKSFIDERSLTHAQINSIFHFICFMAIRGELGMDEDQYAATQKWRQASIG